MPGFGLGAEVPADVNVGRRIDLEAVAHRHLNVGGTGEVFGPVLQHSGNRWKSSFIAVQSSSRGSAGSEFDTDARRVIAGRPDDPQRLPGQRAFRPRGGRPSVVAVQHEIHIEFVRVTVVAPEGANGVGAEMPARVFRHGAPEVPPPLGRQINKPCLRRDDELDPQIHDGHSGAHCVDTGERHTLKIRCDALAANDCCKEGPETHRTDYIGLPNLTKVGGLPISKNANCWPR